MVPVAGSVSNESVISNGESAGGLFVEEESSSVSEEETWSRFSGELSMSCGEVFSVIDEGDVKCFCDADAS